MKQQTRVGKILESLNKRRRVFSEAWNIPNNLRDKKHIKTFLDNAQSAVRKYFWHTFECQDLSNYLDYKTKKVTLKDIKDVIQQTWKMGAFGIILETEDGTVIWTSSANYRDRDYWAHLIHKDGTHEEIRERELPNYTGRAAKATKGYLMVRNADPSYGMSYDTSKRVDPLDLVDRDGKSSTLFSRTKDSLVNLMKLRKALTKIKIDLTKESILANVPRLEKAMKSGVGVELVLDGETYLLFSENNSQLGSSYQARYSSSLWLLTSDDPRDQKEATYDDYGVFRIGRFFSPDLKVCEIKDSSGSKYPLMVYVDSDTGEMKINKNFGWSKYRGTKS